MSAPVSSLRLRLRPYRSLLSLRPVRPRSSYRGTGRASEVAGDPARPPVLASDDGEDWCVGSSLLARAPRAPQVSYTGLAPPHPGQASPGASDASSDENCVLTPLSLTNKCARTGWMTARQSRDLGPAPARLAQPKLRLPGAHTAHNHNYAHSREQERMDAEKLTLSLFYSVYDCHFRLR